MILRAVMTAAAGGRLNGTPPSTTGIDRVSHGRTEAPRPDGILALSHRVQMRKKRLYFACEFGVLGAPMDAVGYSNLCPRAHAIQHIWGRSRIRCIFDCAPRVGNYLRTQ